MADRNKGGGAPARASKTPQAGATAGAAAATADKPKRERLAFSREKKLAYAVIGIATFLAGDAFQKLLTEEQKAKVSKAKELADELGSGDVLKPVTDRILAIQKELKGINYSEDPVKSANQAKELSLEMVKQINRKKQIEEMIGG